MSDTNRGLVVVAEDEPAIADLLALYLTREGYSVEVVGDGRLALDVISTRAPVAAILDVGLPTMAGTEVCSALRSAQNWTPILFCTARDDEIDRVLGLELGADDYITKPFDRPDLVRRVRRLLEAKA